MILDGPPRDAVAATMTRVYQRGLTTRSGGNVSLRDDDGGTWITPAAIDKSTLAGSDIVCVKPDGAVEGHHRPSSELPAHRHVHDTRPELRAVIHAHPAALVAFSMCHQVPDLSVLPHAHQVCGPPGYAPYGLTGSETLGTRIAAVFAEGRSCVILENHGVIVGGETCGEAFRRLETLERAARTIARAGVLGTFAAPTHQVPSAPSVTGVKAPAAELIESCRRAYERGLIGSAGARFSTRIDERSFVSTPPDADPATTGDDEQLAVAAGGLHGGIYETHAGIEAVFEAAPVCATAFALAGAPLETRVVPESRLLLREVTTGPDRIGPERPAALLPNRGVIVIGRSLHEAFDRLEVLESTAEALIAARGIADVIPMSPRQLDELEETLRR